MLTTIVMFLTLGAAWADVAADRCDPILTFVDDEWVVGGCAETVEASVERPSVEFVIEPSRVDIGDFPPYSPLHF
jgi:hypothetical protein